MPQLSVTKDNYPIMNCTLLQLQRAPSGQDPRRSGKVIKFLYETNNTSVT